MSKRTPDRVFLDANVLFSAAYRKDAGLLRLWKRRNCLLLTSGFAREEASRNLDTDAQRMRLVKLLERVNLVSEAGGPASVEEWGLPEKDVPILAAAIRAKASHLLTGDHRHFGHLMGSTVEGALILRPATYLKS